jgi:serine O-acetyltransferase
LGKSEVMNEFIKYDLYRYVGGYDTRSFIRAWYLPGFRYTYFLRKSKIHKKKSVLGLFNRFFLNKYLYKYGIQIPISTHIGKGFYIGHFGNVVINGKTIIGENCNISHGVTIGETNRGKKKGAPIIGNSVWIGTGSVVVGGITIGNNVLIAPLSYINIDIPDNSIVIGNPCKIIPSENATEGYISRILK